MIFLAIGFQTDVWNDGLFLFLGEGKKVNKQKTKM
jgi:hypothetical protein